MKRRLAISTAALLVVATLAACGDGGDADPTGPARSDAVSSPGQADTSSPSGSEVGGPSGCELVTAAMIQETLGVDAGPSEEQPSFIGGPPSCRYETLAMDVQVSLEPDLYLAEDVYDGHDVPGAEPAPPGADRGYVAEGSFVVVKRGIGVFVTAIIPAVTGATPPGVDQWQALAAAVVDRLP